MRRGIALVQRRVLPHGWWDAVRQPLLFLAAYLGYVLVRGVVGTGGYKPFGDATRIINFERSLHVFVEPALQGWVSDHARWLLDVCDWTYLNAHLFVTVGTLAFVYVRRNDSFYFVRNAFMVAMGIALVGYALYPTAPPRLLPEWGFTDSVAQFTGVAAEKAGILINAYAAVPSMHVCFALLIGVTMSRLVAGRAARAVWLAYPVYVTFVVVVTGNHYFTDVALGGLTAALSALLARQLLARARPDVWAFGGAPA